MASTIARLITIAAVGISASTTGGIIPTAATKSTGDITATTTEGIILPATHTHTVVADSPTPPPLYKQSGAPIPQRVADLLSRMNLDEIIAQVAHRYSGMSQATTKAQYKNTSLGQVSMQTMLLNASGGPLSTVRARNAFQQYFITNSRLQIPVSIAQEGLHSGSEFGTVFPMPLLTACSWNDSLPFLMGQVQANEARAYGVDNVFAPVVNMWTDPRFGRFQEGYSPDPVITSHMGTAAVLGLQGGASTQDDYLPGGFNESIWATGKHFCGYGSAIGGLNGAPFVLNNRTLFEQFLRPWRAMAAQGLRGAMPSHNAVLDVPMHANQWLIQSVFRDEFGFGNGAIVSDCNDIGSLNYFGITENRTRAAALGVLAGVDLDLQCGFIDTETSYYSFLPDALQSGLIQLSDLQALVTHILTQKFAAGLFDQPLTPEEWVDERLDTQAHRQLAYEAAAQSIVLLTNTEVQAGGTNVLPLTGLNNGGGDAITQIAFIGPQMLCQITETSDSSSWFSQYGNSYGPLTQGAEGSKGYPYGGTTAAASCYARMNMLGSYTLDTGTIAVPLLPDAFNRTFSSLSLSGGSSTKKTISYTVNAGCAIDNMGKNGNADPNYRLDLIPAAVAAASAADYAIVAVGDSLNSCGEWLDRDSLDLPGGQLALLEALVNQTTTPIILVLINGRAASFGLANTLLSKFAAVLEGWRPGEEGAQALVDIISGAVNPSGKLANQWAQHVGQIGSGAQPFLARRVAKWLANNRSAADPTDGREYDPYIATQYDSTPLFRFGHGLSYTTWEYKTLSVSIVSHPTLDMPHQGVFSGWGGGNGYRAALSTIAFNATVSLCNTGNRDGTEIIQIYSQDPRAASSLRIVPFWKRLVGYGKLFLAANTCGSLVIPVVADDLAQYDDDMNLRIVSGTYIISAGGRSDQDTLQQNVTLE